MKKTSLLKKNSSNKKTKCMPEAPWRPIANVSASSKVTIPPQWQYGGSRSQEHSFLWTSDEKTSATVDINTILETIVEHLASTLFNIDDWVFQQDSAPAHRAKRFKSGYKKTCLHSLKLTNGLPRVQPQPIRLLPVGWVEEGRLHLSALHNHKSGNSFKFFEVH